MYTEDLTYIDLRESSRPRGSGGLREAADLAGDGVGVFEEGEASWADRGLGHPKQALPDDGGIKTRPPAAPLRV